MHPAQRSLFMIERKAALRESGIEAVRFEFSLLPETREKASLVFHPFGRDDERAFQFCFSKQHVALA